MENFEKEFKSKMDTMSNKANVINEIKNNAYKNVTRATPYRARPLRTLLTAAVTIVLLCGILFIISLNIGTPPIDTPSQSTQSNAALQSGTSSVSNAASSTVSDKISESEVKAIITDFSEKHSMYSKINVGFLSVDESVAVEKEFSGEKYSYYKVTDSFKTVNELKEFFNAYETSEQASADNKYFFEYNGDISRPPLYTDINGELYRYADYPFKGTGDMIWQKAEVQLNSKDKLILKIPFSVMGDTSEFKSITLIKADGKWLFSEGFKG
jgi:hypothetical protein